MTKLFKVYSFPHICEDLKPVFESGQTAQGPVVDKFEDMIKFLYEINNCLTVNSATSALHLAFDVIKRMNKLDDDTEVLASPLTCAAGIFPILANRMRVKWVDIDGVSLNVSIASILNKMTTKTRILTYVNWGGQRVNSQAIETIKKVYQNRFGKELFVVEDKAHCSLEKSGNNYEIYSFQSIKYLSTGDGGLLCCPTNESHALARNLRWFGLDRTTGQSFRSSQNISEWGYKFHMNDIAAQIGICNMLTLPSRVSMQTANAHYYNHHINCRVRTDRPGLRHDYWLYTIILPEGKNRAEFIQFMSDRGIECSTVHSRCDKHECVSEFQTHLPVMDDVENSYVCIPVGWWLTDKERSNVVSSVNHFLEN